MSGHPVTLREAMATAASRGRAEGWPRCYYWAAVWWRLHAKESKAPRDPLQYSRNLMALYRDIERRPEHYKSWRRPDGMSDWQWSRLGHNTEQTPKTSGIAVINGKGDGNDG